MRQQAGRGIEAAVYFSRWLVAPFLLGLLCCVIMIIFRFFADLYQLAVEVLSTTWHDLVVGILDLIDLALVANLILIVIFSSYESYIRRIDPADRTDWPPGLTNVDFGTLKQRLLGSIAVIAAVDSLAWYLDLEKFSDPAKLGWAIGFPLMFVVAMVMLAIADRLGRD
jgi:uncharacterized protein (TIGR00645 family)